MRKGTLQFFQNLLLVAGIILLAAYALALIHRSVSSRLALRAFDQARAAIWSEDSNSTGLQGDEKVDFSLWSEKRIREYKESLVAEKRLPLAVLSIEQAEPSRPRL